MNARKRPAPEDSLLPVRQAKVPRTTTLRPGSSNEKASPSQYMGLGARWAEQFQTIWVLVQDTACALFGGSSDAPTEPHAQSPPSPSAPPIRSRLTGNSPPPPSSDRPPLQRPRSTKQPSLRSAPSQSSISQSGSRTRVQKTGLPSPPTTNSTVSSSEFSGSLTGYPEVDVALDRAAKGKARAVGVQMPKEREHIYARQHQKAARKQWDSEIDGMLSELFELKKYQGFSSSLNDLRSLVEYQAKLESLARVESSLLPSRSFSDLRERSKLEAQKSGEQQAKEQFLKRALQKARATLASPRPAEPLTKGFDALRAAQQAKDKAIETRIRPPYPTQLPPDDDAEVDKLLRKRGMVWKCAREQVSETDLSRLRPAQWLNDEIINFYGAMILARSEANKENPKSLKVHYFSSFFWSKLKTTGYEKGRLAKWTKAFDLFQKDVVLFPVNHNNAHWTAAAINFKKKRIESYDSMGMDRSSVYKLLREYLNAEHKNKKHKEFDFSGWTDHVLEDTPQQENGFDCGVFTCQFLETLSRGEEGFPFTQQHMPYLRRRMVWEICNGRLREDT
ncbi:Smt3-specific protease [Steccherinum ochraceum]|uniref:Smt3-specific protease n=1 Tax=Steccherinum ochraceum TaxID=92696 RepID=A0A4V2MXG5_9APHY|nr:Smt3-specific protease [Steccherinum ochraceum]